MRSPDEREAERAKHQMVKWPGYGLHDPVDEVCKECSWWQDDSIRIDYPRPTIIAMDETDEALAEVENWRRAAQNWETWANHHECGGGQ